MVRGDGHQDLLAKEQLIAGGRVQFMVDSPTSGKDYALIIYRKHCEKLEVGATLDE